MRPKKICRGTARAKVPKKYPISRYYLLIDRRYTARKLAMSWTLPGEMSARRSLPLRSSLVSKSLLPIRQRIVNPFNAKYTSQKLGKEINR